MRWSSARCSGRRWRSSVLMPAASRQPRTEAAARAQQARQLQMIWGTGWRRRCLTWLTPPTWRFRQAAAAAAGCPYCRTFRQKCLDGVCLCAPDMAGCMQHSGAQRARCAVHCPVQVLHSSVPPSQLFRVLNGAVVGLCRAPPPQPQQTQQPLCLGLGIVRAADAAARRLHILTAVPEEELECVALLQLGRLELPASLLQTGGHMSPYLALHSLSSAGTGAGAIRSRNNLLRASQL